MSPAGGSPRIPTLPRVPLSYLAAALLIGAAPLPAQKHAKEIERPELPAGSDTNDAGAYLRYAVDQLEKRPEKAADAFYWVTRLDPTSSAAYYGRRVALLLSDHDRLVRYMERSRNTIESKDIRAIDSLQIHALTLDPFIYRRWDQELVTQFLFELARRNGVDVTAMNYYLLQHQRDFGPDTRGWIDYSNARFPAALADYDEELHREKNAYGAHAERSRIFYLIGNYDSALTEMQAALDGMRKRDEKELVFEYDSKAIYEQSIGMIQERLGHTDAARDAYAQALVEDLSYYPAHVQLGQLALTKGDTTSAVNELDLAVQLKGDDPGLRYAYGLLLVEADQDSLAQQQLRKAIELEPHYAAPYQLLARILDAHAHKADAIQMYQTYLAHAAQSDPQYEWTKGRIAYLELPPRPPVAAQPAPGHTP